MNDQTNIQDTKSEAQDTAKEVAPAKKAKGAIKEAMAAPAPLPTVVVTGPEKGRWRIGRHFTREPVALPLDDLTEAEIQALENDPELHVQVIDAPY